MARDPYFKFYVSDWLGSNNRAAMTLEQQGAYINLLARQWSDKTCSLPDDDDALARLSEMGQGWFKGGSHLVRECFPPHPNLDGRIANPKLLELRADRDEWIEKSSEGGRKSAENKKLRQGKGGVATLNTKRQPKAKQPKPKPKTKKKEPPLPPFDPQQAPIPPSLDTPDFRDSWQAWLRQRLVSPKHKKHPVTEEAVKRIFRKLEKWGLEKALEALDNAITGDWRAPVWEPQESRKGGPNAKRSGSGSPARIR